MNEIYSEMQKVASELIGEFTQGAPVYIAVTKGNGPADEPGSAETPYPINAVARGVKFKYVDGTTIIATDLQLTMPADGVVPKMPGFIMLGSKRHAIVKIDTKPPTGVPVAHTIIFRA